MHGWGDSIYGFESSTSNAYLVIGEYDFTANKLRVKAVQTLSGAQLPTSEPEDSWWNAECTPAAAIASIDGIRLNAGAGSGKGTIGTVWWDEIRYATSWTDLVSGECPTAVVSCGPESRTQHCPG